MSERHRLVAAAWPDVPERTVLLVPVGATEQHGPHLPLDVDTIVAEAVSRGAAGWLGGRVRVAPAVAYGASGEHQAFAGTLSIGTEALVVVLTELARSALTWAQRVVFVNGHGGNLDAIRGARAVLDAEGAAVGWHACRHGGVHADRAETSLMLHLAPHRVARERIAPGALEPLEILLPRLRAEGARATSPGGVLGDPAGATAHEGAGLLARMVDDLVAVLGGPE
ncbi:MAG: mycofactocin biosynthesis peptidyl-dipeptidase MftE [Microbacterium sp.]